MKRIIVGSIENARGYKPAPKERYAVISFVDVGAPAPSLKRHVGCVGRLIIHADDVTAHDQDGYTAFSRRDAERIAGFCLRWRGMIDTLVIHCRMGMSRSPAAASAIAASFGISDVLYISQDTIPNRLVEELVRTELRRALGLAH